VPFDRKIFFDCVRPLFGGSLTQQQVDGMNFKLDAWEDGHAGADMRWLAYCLATAKHETASTMWPIAEGGKGKGQPYGEPDPVTGLVYYGRGDVQLTWAENYKNATAELELEGDEDLYLHPDKALDPEISAKVMYRGMMAGWFRPPHNLEMYFNDATEDPFNAREIVNGDKTKVPDWSGGKSIGKLIADYFRTFLTALQASWKPPPAPPGPQPAPAAVHITLRIEVTPAGAAIVTVI
jgi:putative chitinase